MAVALIGAGACVGPTPASDSGSERPNILVFVTDDQRATGTMGVMPNVRRWFARSGRRYTNAFATTPLCCPSRASIFSGLYAHNHGVRFNVEAHDLDQSRTVQRYLHDAGYRTGIAGKFLNQWGPDEPPAFFDRWAIFLEGEYYDRRWNLDGDVRRLPDYTNDVVRDKALEFLRDFESDDERPWFLYVATNAAHAPFTPEPRYERALPGRWEGNPATSEADVSDKPEIDPTAPRRYVRRNQLRTLMSADDTVGLLFDELTRSGELDRTLALFTSDNGMLWGEHSYTGKRLPFLQSVNVPLLLRWPGRVDAGVSEALVGNVDIAPTILEAAGVEARAAMDGRSLLSGPERDVLLLEHWNDETSMVPDWRSLLARRFQYVEYAKRDGSIRFRGYYDLMNDPWQLHNLLGDGDPANDPNITRLGRRLRSLRDCAGESCP